MSTGSADTRFVAGDDFDRKTNEMSLLTTGHKPTVADHLHPTFSSDGARIEIQSAMLSEDNRSMNICIVPVLPGWLQRK
jgi:oligogalacturonide lyase